MLSDDGTELFAGNIDRNSIKENIFYSPINARVVILYHELSVGVPSIRWDLIACGKYKQTVQTNSHFALLLFFKIIAVDLGVKIMFTVHCFEFGLISCFIAIVTHLEVMLSPNTFFTDLKHTGYRL